MIDLRSDTVTQPTAAMRDAMANASVGDDVYGEDPTVNLLETTAAEMLGKQAGLFVPSGTQSNLLALLTHCARGDEYIVDQTAHTYRFEGGGAAVLGGIQPQPISPAADGSLPLEEVRANIKPDDFHFAKSKLLCLENTIGGRALTDEYILQARHLCDETGLCLHLDGARFFNAVIATNTNAEESAAPFDSVSICLSKGLGAPVGSVLVGSVDFIKAARRWRKMLGGGMRQAGVIAAGGLFALQHNVERLALDHTHAGQVATTLEQKFGADQIKHATNMVHVGLATSLYTQLREHLQVKGIRAPRPRWVFHLDIDDADTAKVIEAIEQF